MSIHPSLSTKGKIGAKRSVLKRFERINILKDRDKWDENKSPFGLPKVTPQE